MQKNLRPTIALLVIDSAELMGKRVDENVFADGHCRQRVELLLHEADSGVQGFDGGSQRNLLASDNNLAGVSSDNAAENVHQGRLAGAVRADQRGDPAKIRRELGSIQRDDPWEGLADRPHVKEWAVYLTLPSSKSGRRRQRR